MFIALGVMDRVRDERFKKRMRCFHLLKSECLDILVDDDCNNDMSVTLGPCIIQG